MRVPSRFRTFALALTMGTAAAAHAADYDPAFRVDHSPFDALLAKYVVPEGVLYAEWHANAGDRQALKDYVATLASSKPSKLTRYQGLAFWINAYNAVTVNLILDHYPVDSIKDIGSPWKKKLLTVEGRELSLDEIENDVIRGRWKEPRIHFALNCASVSCPPLRAGAFTNPGLHDQLEEQTVAFLADTATNYVDEKGRLHLSKIFRWYREDFEQENSTLVDWLRPYLPDLATLPEGEDVKIKFAGYDWDLNEPAATE